MSFSTLFNLVKVKDDFGDGAGKQTVKLLALFGHLLSTLNLIGVLGLEFRG